MWKNETSCYWVPLTVKNVVQAVCNDSYRRSVRRKAKGVTDREIETYDHLDKAIHDAVMLTDKGVRQDLLSDICGRKGAQMSNCLTYMSRATYYREKAKLIYQIAINLGIFSPNPQIK